MVTRMSYGPAFPVKNTSGDPTCAETTAARTAMAKSLTVRRVTRES